MFRTFRCHRLMEIASTPCSFSSFPLSSSSCCASSGLFASSVPLLSAPKKSTPVGGPRYNKTTPRASSKKNVHQKSPKQRSQVASLSKSNASPKSSRKLISHHHHHHHASNNDANNTATCNKTTMKKRERGQEASTGDEEASGHLKLVREIYEKMSKQWQQSKQEDQSNKNDNSSKNTSSTSSSPSSSSSCQNWDRLHEIFADLEAKLEIDSKPASFDADKLSVSTLTSSNSSSSAAAGSSATEKQFCFPRVFLSLGLWAQQQQQQQQQQSATTNSDNNNAVSVLPPRTADGLETILRAKCLWLRPDLASAHRRGPSADYWVDDCFRDDFIKKTIFTIFDKPRRVRTALTISEFAKRETLREGSDSFKTTKLLCNKFTNVLYPDEDVQTSLSGRNVSFHELVEIPYVLEASKVAIFCGSSGSGKTIGALSVAKFGNSDNVVFFVSAGDKAFNVFNEKSDRDTRNNNSLNILTSMIEKYVTSEEGLNLDLQKDSDYNSNNSNNNWSKPPFNIVIIIDEIGAKPQLLRGLIAMLDSISARLHRFFFQARNFNDKNWNNESRIRIIAAGTGASYLHGAPGSSNRYQTFVFDTVRESFPNMFNYFGTILKSTVFLEKDEEKNKALHNLLMRLDGAYQRALIRQKAEMWEQVPRYPLKPDDSTLLSTRTDWPTQTEIETGHLLKNARCAALTVQALKTWIGQHFTDHATGVLTAMPTVSMLNDRLPSIIFEVVRRYAEMNGLSKFEATPKEDILKYALAASLHRLPFLPDATTTATATTTTTTTGVETQKKNSADHHHHHQEQQNIRSEAVRDTTHETDNRDTDDKEDADSDQKEHFTVANANEQLLTIGGVLLDVCESSDATLLSQNKISLEPFLPSSSSSSQPTTKQSSSSPETVKKRMTPHVIKRRNFSRYYFSAPHLVMLRSLAGMPLARPPDFSYSFEQSVAEFCGLTAMCSGAIEELKKHMQTSGEKSGTQLVNDFNKRVNKQHDALFGLKQHLSFGPSITDVKILQLIDSPLRNIKRLFYGNNSEVTNSAKTKMHLLKMDIVAALKAGQAVVILSREMEPFADVIVVGPGRVLLIQCKQRNQVAGDYFDSSSSYVKGWAKVNVSEELFKMGVIDFTAKNAKGKKIAEKLETSKEMHDLRVEYLKCLKDAANEDDESKKEAVVVPIFMLEVGSSLANGSLTADKFLSETREQVKVEFERYIVARPGTKNADRLTASPFFPVPFTCEAVTDNGKYLTVAETKRRDGTTVN